MISRKLTLDRGNDNPPLDFGSAAIPVAPARFRVAQFHVFGVHTLVWSDTAELAGLPEHTG
jgi:hypothetical protein